MQDFEIAKNIFLLNLSIMKKTLDLMSFKFGKSSQEYLYLKKQIMDDFYIPMKKLFNDLERKKILKKCECKANLRHGYSSCNSCGGSGYKNN